MPVRKVQRFTEQDVQRIVARGNGSTPPDVLAFISATSLPTETDGCPAQAAGSRVNEGVAGTQGGFVMLGYPVSVNRYWRSFKGRTVISSEATKYKQHVQMDYAQGGGLYFYDIPVSVEFKFHPKTTKTGDASKTRMDLDNVIKVVLDALQGVAYMDDKQVRKLTAEIADPVSGGGLSVRVTA